MNLTTATTIAQAIHAQLAPHCQRIHIAGSVLRKKAEPGDIEIVCMPRTVPGDIFNSTSYRSPDFIKAVKALGAIIKGKPEDGKMVQVQTSANPLIVTLDLFIPSPHDYYRILAIRTGPAEYSHRIIAGAWLKKGWCGTDLGLRRQIDCFKRDIGGGKQKWMVGNKLGEQPPVRTSERDFFEWLGLEWIAPEKRGVPETINAHND